MAWTQLEDRWIDLVDAIRKRWPQTDAVRLRALAGDMGQFARYLAEAHDLTVREATEAIEEWLSFSAPQAVRA